jgi:hypothetical protein
MEYKVTLGDILLGCGCLVVIIPVICILGLLAIELAIAMFFTIII